MTAGAVTAGAVVAGAVVVEAAAPEDALLCGRVRLRQPEKGYRAAIDPVLLAAAVNPAENAAVLEVGCGTGAALLCLAVRRPDLRLTGLEKLPQAAALARENVALNGASGRAAVLEGCLLTPPTELTTQVFDHIMMNPPYLAADRASPPPDPWKAAANVEGDARLVDWIGFARARLRPKGVLTLIHRADRLGEIMAALAEGFGGVIVFPLWPRAGQDAKRVIVQATKGVKTPARLAAGLTLHGAAGGYAAAAAAVLNGAALMF